MILELDGIAWETDTYFNFDSEYGVLKIKWAEKEYKYYGSVIKLELQTIGRLNNVFHGIKESVNPIILFEQKKTSSFKN